MSDLLETIEEIVVDGTKSAKSIMKALMDLDETLKRWRTLQQAKVDDARKMKNVTPKKKEKDALDVDYKVIEESNPQRNQARSKAPSK